LADQQQTLTLSLRISEALRNRLEQIREITSRRKGESVSISEVAKQLLESARADRMETVELFSRTTEALLEMRRKGESGQPLTRAEWTVLAHFVQRGAEANSKNQLARELLAEILKAFEAVYKLRTRKSSDRDVYYVGNLPSRPHRAAGHSDPITPDVVRQAISETLKMCVANEHWAPVFAGRNLFVLLDDEPLAGVDAINKALRPYWPVLWRIAARGHYADKRKPVRDESLKRDYILKPIMPKDEGGYSLSFARGGGNELHLLLSFPGDLGTMYPIGRYPHIAEFRAMLYGLRPKQTEVGGQMRQSGNWDGNFFFGYIRERDKNHEYWFRAQDNGITLGFTEEQWKQVQALFNKAWEEPEVQSTWNELSLEYGEL